MKTEQIIQRLNSILERNSDRKVNQLIPEDVRQLKISIKELEQGQSLPIDGVSKCVHVPYALTLLNQKKS